MVSSCWAPNCTNRYKREKPIKFYRFPHNDPERMTKWLKAIKRTPGPKQTTTRSDGFLQPTTHARLCSIHFISGTPTFDPMDIDYTPSLFPLKSKSRKERVKLKRQAESDQRYQEGERKSKRLVTAQTLLSLASIYRNLHSDSNSSSDCAEVQTCVEKEATVQTCIEKEATVYCQTDELDMLNKETQTVDDNSFKGAIKVDFKQEDLIHEHNHLHQRIQELEGQLKVLKDQLEKRQKQD